MSINWEPKEKPMTAIELNDKQIHDTATKNGCTPVWYDGIVGLAWHCGCASLIHACDQQCSAISPSSAQRKAL